MAVKGTFPAIIVTNDGVDQSHRGISRNSSLKIDTSDRLDSVVVGRLIVHHLPTPSLCRIYLSLALRSAPHPSSRRILLLHTHRKPVHVPSSCFVSVDGVASVVNQESVTGTCSVSPSSYKDGCRFRAYGEDMSLKSVGGSWSLALCLTCSDAADAQIEERRALGQELPAISIFLFTLLHSFVSVVTGVSLRFQSGFYSTNRSTTRD